MCDEKIVELTIRKPNGDAEVEKFKVRKINGVVSIDNGININSAVLARILQKYKQAENEIAG